MVNKELIVILQTFVGEYKTEERSFDVVHAIFKGKLKTRDLLRKWKARNL